MTAGPDIFLDTNILIYAATGHDAAPEKHEIAQGLLTVNFGTSAQVMAEFYNATTRRIKVPLSPEVASEWVSLLSRKPCLDITPALVRAGIRMSQRYKTSYFDGAILAAAKQMGATKLITEDLSHLQNYDGVIAVNPFKPGAFSSFE